MQLTVQPREITGKKVKSLRKAGLVPAVIYGSHLSAPITVSIDKVQLVKAVKKAGTSTAIELKGDGVDELVLLQDMQLHPVSDSLMHTDFIAVQKDVKVTAEVSVSLTGESPYEKSGEGRVQLLKDSIEVEALPMDLPHDLTIDATALDHEGQVIFAKDITLGDKVTLITDPELAMVTTVAFVEEVEEEVTAELTEEGTEEAAPEAAE